MKLRSVLFWLHLTCGVLAGVIILIMSVTGVLLTYQRQITAWADTRGYTVEPASQRLPAATLGARVAEARPDVVPTAIVLRAEPSSPASLAIGAGRQLFVDPYTGAVLGEGNGERVRAFFRVVVEWHRYLGASGASRPLGRAITGASNLAFLFIVVSGIFLWVPRSFTRPALRSVTWFKGGLRGKARDFNWHNTIGVWSAIPLAIIVAGSAVISYPWATALVYRLHGEAPPAPTANAPARSADARPVITDFDQLPLEQMIVIASAQVPDWKTMSIALPAPTAARVVATLDSGDGGQPHKRGTLTLDRQSGNAVRWEPFSSQSSGRRTRTWLRFAHTGEVYGLAGQTVAGLVSAGGAVLVWTGIALAIRRFDRWRKRAISNVAERAA